MANPSIIKPGKPAGQWELEQLAKFKEAMLRSEVHTKNMYPSLEPDDPLTSTVKWLQARVPKLAGEWKFDAVPYRLGNSIQFIASTDGYEARTMSKLTKPDPFPPPELAMLEFMDEGKVPRVHRSREELLHEMMEFFQHERELHDRLSARTAAIRAKYPGVAAPITPQVKYDLHELAEWSELVLRPRQ